MLDFHGGFPTSVWSRQSDINVVTCLFSVVAVKMVTGDQQLIGVETARQLGMGTNIHKVEVLLQVGRTSASLLLPAPTCPPPKLARQ